MLTFFNRNSKNTKTSPASRPFVLSLAGGLLGIALLIYIVGYSNVFALTYTGAVDAMAQTQIATSTPPKPTLAPLDTLAYNSKLLAIANYPAPVGTTTISSTTLAARLWPVKTAYPKAGALLPFNRIVAYYGNFYSTQMGVLGQYPEDVMLQKLASTTAAWAAADPSTPVIPAIDYIAITAQGSPGADGKYRARMPNSQIDHALELAKKVNGIVILDLQVGLSTLPQELPLLDTYLKMPQVEVAIDPEFAMHNGAKPGTVIGSFDATDINYAANYLAKIVDYNNLPPKILIVHRFTGPMVTHYKNITPLPEVQIVMDMDGWGSPSRKLGTYNAFIALMPVEFTGFKLFYKNDIKPPSTRMLTPAEILKLTPQPLFIQYQ
ncbi:MAG TPA: hypothetical protein VIJ88_00115 [Candidatus Paceibacterota bacterium]